MRITLPTLIFLSLLFGIINFLDTTSRLFFYYMSEIPYPLSTLLKPIFFMLQTVFLILFISKLIISKVKDSSHRAIRSLLVFQLLIILVFLTIYFSSFAFPLQGQFVELAEFVLFWLGPAISSFWIAFLMFQRQKRNLSIAFLIIGFAFLTKPLEGLYFWTQTYFNFALPYHLVSIGMFGPLLIMAIALLSALVVIVQKFKIRINFTTLFSPYFWAACAALAFPVVLVVANHSLGNLIIRAVVYWGLSYSGFDWYSVSLLLLSLVVYIYIVRKLGSKLDDSLPSNLIKLGCLSFVWNGVAILLFGYSSIPGNLLSLDAIAAGLMLRWTLLNES